MSIIGKPTEIAESIADYSFQGRLIMSTGSAIHSGVEAILLENIPGAQAVERAQLVDDKAGVDYWVYREKIRPLAIDTKVRDLDPIDNFDSDDLALEIWSVIEANKMGWTLDATRESDYILWLFEPTGRWVLIPFPMLCAVFNENKGPWTAAYKTKTQSSDNGRWHSQCVFVPRIVIWRAIYRRYS